jgi:hypothetical protein
MPQVFILQKTTQLPKYEVLLKTAFIRHPILFTHPSFKLQQLERLISSGSDTEDGRLLQF